MVSRLTKVIQDLGIAATSIFKSISENNEAVIVKSTRGQVSILVGGLCQGLDGPGQTSGVECDGPKQKRADYMTEEFGMFLCLACLRSGLRWTPDSIPLNGRGSRAREAARSG